MEKETLDFQAIYAILGERPFKSKDNFQKYLEEVIEEYSNVSGEIRT